MDAQGGLHREDETNHSGLGMREDLLSSQYKPGRFFTRFLLEVEIYLAHISEEFSGQIF